MKSLKYMMMLAAGAFAAAGCTDITDYPDGRMDFETVFQNPKLTGGYMNACYSEAVASYGDPYGDKTYMASVCDEGHDTDDATGGTMYKWNSGFMTPFMTPWEHAYTKESEKRVPEWNYYAAIRRCNIMIDRVETATIRLESDRESYRGEARGLRAYYYLRLLKNYGAVPLVLDNVSESEDDWSGVRKATYSEVVRQIFKDCAEVIGYKPADYQIHWAGEKEIPGNGTLQWKSGSSDDAMFRWNKAMSAAVMSEAALYAASPLNNDGTLDWPEAAEVCGTALAQCLANGLQLVTTLPTGDFAKNSYNAYDHYFISTIDARGANDTESIIYTSSRQNAWQYCGLPTTEGQSRAGSCPSQELVDSYETIDGVMPILGYADADHLQPIINPAATSYDPSDPYANRDPRLKATLYYHGARLMPLDEDPDKTVDISEGGNCMVSPSSVRYTRTGYYIRKFSAPSSSRNGNNDGWMRQMRLAELYLNFAEAANEAFGPDAKIAAANNMSAVEAVNAVRARVGMPPVPSGLSRDEFRVRVRNERRVELAYEGHRFYDVRRWKILDQTDRLVTGMKAVKNADGTVDYQRFVVSRRNAYSDKWLRLPVPGDEVARLLTHTGINFQNPGWE